MIPAARWLPKNFLLGATTISNNTGSTSNSAPTLAKEIRLRDGLSLVVGGIIGSGIFLVPAAVSMQLTSLSGVMLVWLFGGLLSLAGALSLAELGAAIPRTGGLYVYLEEAYGSWAGFLYGWIHFTMTNSGTVATLGAAFALYVSQLIPVDPVTQKIIGIASILVLTVINCFGVKAGTLVQNIFTIAKVGGLGLVVFFLLLRGRPGELWTANLWPEDGFTFAIGPFGIALIAVLWAYEGWHAITFNAGEFKNPTRDIPRSLAWGTAIILGIYMITILAYHAVLTGPEITSSETVAATAITRAVGPWAGAFVSLLILTSIFGANNMQVLAGPRVMYAMAKDGLFFRAFARVHPRWHTPVFSIWAQGILASLLTLVATFQELFTYVIFTHWIFYAATVAGVIVLRFKRPDLERPYRVPLYPWVPLLFVLASAGMIINNIFEDWYHSLIGIAFVLSGLPAYWFFRSHAARKQKQE